MASTMRLSGRHVVKNVPRVAVCVIPVREIAEQTIRVSALACETKKIEPYIAQGAAVVLKFEDVNVVDYTGVSEITFDAWRDGKSGSSIYSGSLTGGQVTVPDSDFFRVSIDNATSAGLPAGRHWCEAWVTLSGGERRLVGAGWLKVQDTRKHDA